ncbi:hypothetical protein TIFTF001_029180 [Ficus carica]|uniref:Uncharacterized protein n=1 Tax=Ficus carica TaxID=3494 RepID=A0AA88IXP2_FICCA|nr:hypothetical protein TIFTF001_029180 [Ficus carica]
MRCLDLSRDEPIVIDRTRRSVSLVGWLNDMETIFRVCRIEAHFRVVLASRCLAGNARLWWLTFELPDVQRLAWADLRGDISATLQNGMPTQTSPWAIIAKDSGRQCYIPRELDYPKWQALHIIRDRLTPEVKRFVLAPIR